MSIKLNEIKDSKLRDKIIAADAIQNHRVPQSAKHQSHSGGESMGAYAGEDVDSMRRPVRIKITSFRTKLTDGDNLFGKYFVDALIEAGLAPDDSPEWCAVEVKQALIYTKAYECTEIEVEYGPSQTQRQFRAAC